MKLYRWADENDGLPKEDVWLDEDWPVWNFRNPTSSYKKRFITRNEHAYSCNSGSDAVPPYERVSFQRLETLSYQVAESLESFLQQNPGVAVVSHQGQIFIKTWFD